MAYDWRAGMQRLGSGLGQARNALLPIPEEVASQLDPRTVEALRRQAVLQAGLGMMSAGEKGAGLGTGAMYGLNQAQQGLGQGVNQAWMGQRAAREDQRLNLQESRYDAMLGRQERLDTRQTERDRIEDERWQKSYDLSIRNAEAIAGRAAADDARQAAALNLQRQGARVDAQKTELEVKRDQAVFLTAKALGKMSPTHPRYQEMAAQYKGLTGRDWDRSSLGGLGSFAPTGPTSLNDIPID